jgi:isoleucyl-tRNA synthetase
MGTLWNTYAFYVLYAEIDQFNPSEYTLDYKTLSVMDKWLFSKLNSMVQTVDNNLENYRIPESARALQEFVDDMSNWYVRRGRERFWADGMEQDKINAYMTLYTALVTTAKAAAPLIPFMTEDIYQNLVVNIDKNAPESIHLCDYPVADEAMIDKQLEADMDEVLKIVVLGRAARNSANIKNRQPIGKMFIAAESELSEFYKEIIEDELNVKSAEFTQDVSSYTTYTFKPQLKTVGPKYGKQLGDIRNALGQLDGNAAWNELETSGVLSLELSSGKVELAKEDLLIEMTQQEGYQSESDGGITVVLDTKLDDALLEEGLVRELISKIQNMRKEAGFEVTDKIIVYNDNNEKIADILAKNADVIKHDVLAKHIILGETKGFVKDWNINGEIVTIGVEQSNS